MNMVTHQRKRAVITELANAVLGPEQAVVVVDHKTINAAKRASRALSKNRPGCVKVVK